jgi:hypothetical protein
MESIIRKEQQKKQIHTNYSLDVFKLKVHVKTSRQTIYSQQLEKQYSLDY